MKSSVYFQDELAIKEVTLIPPPYTKAGKILTLGQGDVGQLGLGDEIQERKRPAPIKDVDGIQFMQVACGGMHTAGVTQQGGVN